ncbi:hypothetical protein Lal_00026136 [Lupinus albus]|nr:hypothetical protein Lal_00026136 [Lupinus albus]
MATSLNTLQSYNSANLPYQSMVNPNNVSAITLRSGKEIEANFDFEKEDDLVASNKKHLVFQESGNTSRRIHVSEPSSSVEQ